MSKKASKLVEQSATVADVLFNAPENKSLKEQMLKRFDDFKTLTQIKHKSFMQAFIVLIAEKYMGVNGETLKQISRTKADDSPFIRFMHDVTTPISTAHPNINFPSTSTVFRLLTNQINDRS